MAASRFWYSQAVAVEALSLVGILVSIPPIVLLWKNRNFPATCILLWCTLLNLFNVINAIIWPNDDMSTWWNGVGLCDIEIKFMSGAYVGIPGALLCIFRSLAVVLDTNCATLVPSRSQRWCRRAVDILFCVVVPALAMILQIVYQKSRYLLFGISGCVSNYDESWMSVGLSFMWPLIILIAAAYYCCIVLYRLHLYKSQFSEILASSNSKLSKSRFFRIFLLAFFLLLGILPLSAWIIYVNITDALPKWHVYSWKAAHPPNWGVIRKVPSHGHVFFDRWNPVVTSCVAFLFFGFGRDATRLYRSWLVSLGFVRCFPGLAAETTRRTTFHECTSGSDTLSGSIYNQARILFAKKWPSTSRADSHASISMDTLLGKYSGSSRNRGQHPPKTTTPSRAAWIYAPRRLFRSVFLNNIGDGDGHAHLSRNCQTSTTIHTKAWTETSHTRSVENESESVISPATEGFIGVKQVISQQSEVQV